MKKQIKTFLSLSKTEGIMGTLKMIINAFFWSYSKYILKNRFIVKLIWVKRTQEYLIASFNKRFTIYNS